MRYLIYKLSPEEAGLEGCMELSVINTCKKPSYSFFDGANGPYYRCRKHTINFLNQRPDFEMVEGET